MPRAVRRNRDGLALRLPASTEFPRRSLFRSFVCAPASAREPAAWTRLYREHWPAGQAGSVLTSSTLRTRAPSRNNEGTRRHSRIPDRFHSANIPAADLVASGFLLIVANVIKIGAD